jgi:hypothetical protein
MRGVDQRLRRRAVAALQACAGRRQLGHVAQRRRCSKHRLRDQRALQRRRLLQRVAASLSASSAITRKVVSLPPVTVSRPFSSHKRVVARFLGRIGFAAIDDGAHAGVGGDDVVVAQVQLRNWACKAAIR